MEDLREEYEKPQVESEDLYERTALSCSGGEFYNNSGTNIKDNSYSCGFNDS
ncbi:MAG: hypothetical protein V2B20_15365 [Pseudomonadota bacterium]